MKGNYIYKGNLYLWRELEYIKGKMIYKEEDLFMKAKMHVWRRRYICKGEDVFMKGKTYFWRRRYIYKGGQKFLEILKEKYLKEKWNAFQKPKKFQFQS